jgi:hypothetical protein
MTLTLNKSNAAAEPSERQTLAVDQHADFGEALQWHAAYIYKLMTGTEVDGVTYLEAAGYRDDALRRAGMPPMGVLNEALTTRRDAAVSARMGA